MKGQIYIELFFLLKHHLLDYEVGLGTIYELKVGTMSESYIIYLAAI